MQMSSQEIKSHYLTQALEVEHQEAGLVELWKAYSMQQDLWVKDSVR